ncbi:protein RER1 isoform X2 [Xenopus laevis]|uniref:Protein RER1 n=2 Tax=Xenopus laevis TaxID=8355 RepID=A0A8J0TG51_XENLA|nr:protein RER1 isoform X2 [Xenopus laevis]
MVAWHILMKIIESPDSSAAVLPRKPQQEDVSKQVRPKPANPMRGHRAFGLRYFRCRWAGIVTCTDREFSVPTRAGPRRNIMSEGDSVGESVHGKPSVVFRFFSRFGQIYQSFLDRSTPYAAVRWAMTLSLSLIYMIRVYILQGWYIVTYALGIYHLNLFIAFLSPKVDPSLMEDSDEGPSLPTKQNEEFRPFIRRLPEFKFWHSATKGVVVAMGCTFFDAFNVPVFWPILVMYFIMLFCITMKRQIKHMIKYRYIPFTHGKRKYKGKEEPAPGKPFSS